MAEADRGNRVRSGTPAAADAAFKPPVLVRVELATQVTAVRGADGERVRFRAAVLRQYPTAEAFWPTGTSTPPMKRGEFVEWVSVQDCSGRARVEPLVMPVAAPCIVPEMDGSIAIFAVTTTACAAAGRGAVQRIAAAAAVRMMCRAFTRDLACSLLPHRQR